MTTAIFLLVLFVTAALHPLATNSAPISGLDTFLARQSRLDPKSTNDSFASLPSSIKKSLSSPSSLHIPSLISSILSLELPISLHVRLVGESFSPESPSILSTLLSASHSSDHFHIISPSADHFGHHSPSPSNRLAFRHSSHLDVSVSPPSLSSRLSTTLQSLISSATSPLRSALLPILYDPIDQIIKQDFENEKPVQGVYIYILSLDAASKRYGYSYSHGDASPGRTKCLGSIWTGKERYFWIDLGAGPVDYGPALSGDGVIPRGGFHPLATKHGRPKVQKELLSDLASLIHGAYQVLIVPSLRIPVHFEDSLIVQFIHIHGSESKDSTGLDWKTIERTFMDEIVDGGLLLGGQSLGFKHYSVNFDECSICSFAISRSINSYTSRFLFDNYTLIVSEYLDSKRLHQIITSSAEEFRRVAGVPEDDFSSRVLPVYVFDLDYNMLLLLDRFHQSIAFKDMVIAVRTKNTQTVSDYSCNGHHVFTRTRELERPLVGSILQSMWGVSPTHLNWSPRHNSTVVDYTWSIGQTPFGPFSELSSLSFVQKDAARRNVILTALNYSIASAIDVLESISAHGGERNLLKQGQRTEFTQRWNLFKYKMDKAVTALSHFDFEMAVFYLRSSDNDLFALHSFVYQATQEIDASLVCFKDPPFPWTSLSLSAFVLLLLLYVYTRRNRLFRNKRKRF